MPLVARKGDSAAFDSYRHDMEIRPATSSDLESFRDIDGASESTGYLHLEHAGEGLNKSWRVEERPLREKLIDANRLDDDGYFAAKQIISGIEEGVALVAEHETSLVAALIAQLRAGQGTLHVLDLRIDYDFRRQGLGTAMLYQIIQRARQQKLRAVSIETLTNNLPAANLLAKCGFELSGLDMYRRSNHDLVKESATIFWYAVLD